MSALDIRHLSLVFHIIGICLVVGSNIVAFLVSCQFWKLYKNNKEGALVLLTTISKVHKLIIAGIIVLAVSGVSILATTQFVFLSQVWFKIKIGIIAALILNGRTIGKMNERRLYTIAHEGLQDLNNLDTKLLKIRRRINIFYATQWLLLSVLLILSIFKFN